MLHIVSHSDAAWRVFPGWVWDGSFWMFCLEVLALAWGRKAHLMTYYFILHFPFETLLTATWENYLNRELMFGNVPRLLDCSLISFHLTFLNPSAAPLGVATSVAA